MSIEQANQIRALTTRADNLECRCTALHQLIEELQARVDALENAVTAPEKRKRG